MNRKYPMSVARAFRLVVMPSAIEMTRGWWWPIYAITQSICANILSPSLNLAFWTYEKLICLQETPQRKKLFRDTCSQLDLGGVFHINRASSFAASNGVRIPFRTMIIWTRSMLNWPSGFWKKFMRETSPVLYIMPISRDAREKQLFGVALAGFCFFFHLRRKALRVQLLQFWFSPSGFFFI